MKCPLCNNELRIAASFLQSREEKDGGSAIYSVIDLQCADPQCPNGKKRMPIAREERLAAAPAAFENAVTCCGEPLCYVNGAEYWAPDGSAAALSDDGATLTVVCRNCGRRHSVEL